MYIYQHLQNLNDLSEAEATSAFARCYGSERWATAMAVSRPYRMIGDLFAAAEHFWAMLPLSDGLEAAENAAMDELRREPDLAEIADLYRRKFGFPLVVFPDGNSKNELLRTCTARFNNSAQTEIQLTQMELRKIAMARLSELLEHALVPHADNTAAIRI